MKKNLGAFFCFLLSVAGMVQQPASASILFYGDPPRSKHNPSPKRERFSTCLLCGDCTSGNIVGNIIYDILDLHKHLFSVETFKVASFAFPFIGMARMFDDTIHHHFYDRAHHKNRNQPPGWCSTVTKLSIGAPALFFGLNAIFSTDEEFVLTTRMLLVGLPFLIWTKHVLRSMEFDICRRPWSEHFSCKERGLGGFPSGHMAEAVYAATLYGLRLGPAYAIPTGVIALAVGGIFVACNRHYFSQVVAGAALGVIYGFAADKVVEDRVKHWRTKVSVEMNGRGPAVNFRWKF